MTDSPQILTAVVFIRAVAAVVLTVTQPHFRDTPVVITGKVAGVTCGGKTSGTVRLIRAVPAVIRAITAPTGRDTVLVVAGERVRRAGRSW